MEGRFFTVLLLFLALTATTSTIASQKSVVCYYGSWASYRPYPAQHNPEQLDPALCTHAVYAFAGLDAAAGTITTLDAYNDLEENYGKGGFRKFTALADQGIVPLLAVGGWNEGSAKYSQMASTEEGRVRFAESAVSFVQRYGFQGLDLDWEYPATNGGVPADRDNLVLLCRELYSRLSAEGLQFSIAAGATRGMTNTSYDVPALLPYVDFINLMTYEYHTPTSDVVTGMLAPLQPREGDSPYLNVEATVEEWLSAGAPASKLRVGAPLYGRSYTLADAAQHGVGAPIAGAGVAGPYTQEPGNLAYLEICMSNWTEIVLDDGDVYAYAGNQWVSFKNAETIEAMGAYTVESGLDGINIWSIESDDINGVCGNGARPLLSGVNRGVGRL